MKVGFIGTGSMGSLLIEAFIRSEAMSSEQIIAHNRTRAKAEKLAEKHPGIQVADSITRLADQCEMIFLCIKPLEYKQVLEEIRPSLKPSQQIVSITSPVLLRHLETCLPSCKIAKIIPSITNYERSGAMLCMFGDSMSAGDRRSLLALLETIGRPLEIDESHTRVTSDLSSCGPAFLAFFLDRLIEAAVAETGIDYQQAAQLVGEMTLGTGRLLTSGGFSPKTLQDRVSVPGGITAEAIRMMEGETDGMFNRIFTTTHAKYREDVEKIDDMLCGQSVD